MTIAIIVHSLTGNTRKFADSLHKKLEAMGHQVYLTLLETTTPIKGGSVHQKMDISFASLPDITTTELIFFGGPVWAFGPSPIIIEAMKQLGTLKGKTVIPFATMGFPLKFMGGNGSLRYMNRTAGTLGAKVLPGCIVCQMLHNLDAEIATVTERLVKLV